ncbi:MAG: hypothetical protein IKH23_10555 [Clostridiales bacterium]|nr:hypothetical protein [Clostridiales bacterium]
MDLDFDVLKQVAYSLADHYLCVYYVNVNSGRYVVVTGEARQEDKNSDLPVEGNNFFADVVKNAPLFIHPDDLDTMLKIYDKNMIRTRLNECDSYSVSFRTLVNGESRHMRHIVILCKDKKHIVCCLEDVEDEYREVQK